MTSLLDLTAAQPTRSLAPEEILIVQGEGGGDLFVLLSGELSVTRDGVEIATLSQPGTLVGEMSVLLGTRNTATVRARRESKLKAIRDAAKVLESEPKLAMRVGAVVAGRLDATSALLVELSRQGADKAVGPGLFSRIVTALALSAGEASVERRDLFGGGPGN
ncbi:MAG: cyclic nucleotide-binding domain-containing protein [Devosia sp.]